MHNLGFQVLTFFGCSFLLTGGYMISTGLGLIIQGILLLAFAGLYLVDEWR